MRIRPVYAVLERELLRMARQRTRLVAAMVRPLIWLLVIGGGFAAFVGVDYKSFLVPGVVGVRIKVTKLEIFRDCQVAISAECGTW